LTLGDCFFTPETERVRRHLWIVVSDPAKDPLVVIVNVSTKPSPGLAPDDPTCGVAAGEHQAVSRDCYVRCDEARLIEPAKLEQLFQAGKLTATQAASSKLILKIHAALGASRETPLEVKAMLRFQGLIARPLD
jgi:hypothetical protein